MEKMVWRRNGQRAISLLPKSNQIDFFAEFKESLKILDNI
jgi:hypothetical protein